MDIARMGGKWKRSAAGGVELYADGAVTAEAIKERNLRAAKFRELLPTRQPFRPMRIADGNPKGYGHCEHCDEPMSAHRTGACPLCEAAIRLARGIVAE